ncbi:MAG: hypothetical protein QF393_06775 [Rhodospirillales bacterium]|jgi:hypothetical protein|nr:hypothetical protein [Rhodospirillales bacterium]MDP6642652.1 hypothetical protein [Rhodospirillales bacterium]
MPEPDNGNQPRAPLSRADATALAILRLAAAVSPFAIFLALPPFYNGIWVQVEGAMPWLHLASAVAAAAIAWLAARGNPEILAILGHPLILAPSLIAAVSILLLPWSTLWGLSVLGSPEHGFGALAFLDAAVLTAAMMSAWHARRWRTMVLIAVIVAAAGAFSLDALFQGARSWAPFFFSDYLAFYAIYGFVIVMAWINGRDFAYPRARYIIGGVLFLGLIILSANKAAILSSAAALAALPLIWKLRDKRLLGLICASFPILVGVATILVGPLWDDSYRDSLAGSIGIRPLADLITSSWPSLWSRAMLVVVGWQTLIDDPIRFITGIGWGHYSEVLLTNLTVVEGRLHEFIGQSKTYWDAIRRNDFHSHNIYFESLLSLGIVGLLLTAYYLYAIVRTARDGCLRLAVLFVLLLGTLQSFWFQMPHSLPVMAAALAALSARPKLNDGRTGPGTGPAIGSFWRSSSAALGAVILLAGSITGHLAADTARAALNANRNAETPADRHALASGIYGGITGGLEEIYRASLLQNAFSRLAAEKEEKGSIAPRSAERLKVLLLPVLRKGAEIKSAALTVTAVNVLAGLVFRFPEFEKNIPGMRGKYIDFSEMLLQRMPRRTDLAIPYFNLMIRDSQEPRALRTAEVLLSKYPSDAVALWFSGITLLANPEKAKQGMARMRRALEYGIRNRIPIAPTVLRRLTR